MAEQLLPFIAAPHTMLGGLETGAGVEIGAIALWAIAPFLGVVMLATILGGADLVRVHDVQATARAVGEESKLRSLGAVTVKGKTEAVNVFAVDIQPRPWPTRPLARPPTQPPYPS